MAWRRATSLLGIKRGNACRTVLFLPASIGVSQKVVHVSLKIARVSQQPRFSILGAPTCPSSSFSQAKVRNTVEETEEYTRNVTNTTMEACFFRVVRRKLSELRFLHDATENRHPSPPSITKGAIVDVRRR